MDVGYQLAEILNNHTTIQVISENERLMKQLQSYQQVNVMNSHRDTTFAFGNINQGYLTDSIVHEHGMFNVKLASNRFETMMTLNSLGSIKIELGCCNFISIAEATEVAFLTLNDDDVNSDDSISANDAMIRLMLGTYSKHVILTLSFQDLTLCEFKSLKMQMLTYHGGARNYKDAMQKGLNFLRKLMYGDGSLYKDKNVHVVDIAFRLSSVQRMITIIDKDNNGDGDDNDDDSRDVFQACLMKDKNSLSFKRKIAKMINVEPPGITIR